MLICLVGVMAKCDLLYILLQEQLNCKRGKRNLVGGTDCFSPWLKLRQLRLTFLYTNSGPVSCTSDQKNLSGGVWVPHRCDFLYEHFGKSLVITAVIGNLGEAAFLSN